MLELNSQDLNLIVGGCDCGCEDKDKAQVDIKLPPVEELMPSTAHCMGMPEDDEIVILPWPND